VPDELRETVGEMGRIGVELAERVGELIEDKDVKAAGELEAEDDAMDRLHRAMFTALMAKDSAYSIEMAIDLTLVSRYYERFADHAVSVANRVVFAVTGEHETGV